MIRLDNVTRRFGALTAVNKLSLDIAKGEIFGLVGPDGAGKTTTLRMLCGLLDPHEGHIEVCGLDVTKRLDDVKDRIGYMAQKFGLYGDLTVEENMRFYSDLFGLKHDLRDKLSDEFLAMTRMAPFRDRAAAKLSGGMKQKLALMCTLLHRPDVLFLDEPTNGVDPLSRRDFWTILYQLANDGMTIFVSTAYLDEAERCHRVGLMSTGRLIHCDTPANLRAQLAPSCFSLQAPEMRKARLYLAQQPGVVGSEPAGAAVHVYIDLKRTTPSQLEESLAQAGLGPAVLKPLDPSLEDVFIALIRAEEQHAAA